MKLHLPKCLYAAVVSAAMVTTAYAGNVADVTNTVHWVGGGNAKGKATVITPEYVGDDIESLKSELTDAALKQNKCVRPTVYSSSSEKTITEWGSTDSAVTLSSGLFVREGALTLKNCNLISNLGQYQSSGSVSGNNATLILDNTTMKSASGSSDIYYVGGQSGEGKLILQNESNLFIDTWMIVGLSKYTAPQGNSGYNTTITSDDTSGTYTNGIYTDPKCPYSDDSSGNKKGAYNDYNTGHEYGTGTIEVTGGSKLTLGGGIGLREAVVTVSGQGSVIETGTKYTYAPSGNNEEKSDLIGRGSGGVSKVNILDGGKWHTHSWFTTASLTSFETKSYITVDGAGSVLQADKGLGLGYGVGNEKYDTPNVGSTEMFVTNGGKVIAGDIYVGLGDKNHADKSYNRRGANPVYLYIDKDSSMETAGTFRVNKAVYGLTYTVDTDGFEVNIVNEGTITCSTMEMDGGNLHNTGTINVSGALTLAGGNITLDISEANATKAAITAGSVNVATADGSDYEVQLTVNGNLKAGKYMLLATGDGIETAAAYSRAATPQGQVKFILPEEINGMSIITDEDGCIILTLNEQLLLIRDPLFNAVQAANWGVFKSSQAFTGTLWGPRDNAVVISPDFGKGGIVPSGRHIAWGTVYSSFDRQQSSSDFSGSDSSLYGAAIGTEYQFASGKSVGIAFGYDFGKVSPFSCSSVDQDSWHAAVYGRAANWNVGKRGSIALDWSVATGSTTSDSNELGADWTQDNVQLEARATYAYQLNDRTALSAFVGAQYYAQNDDSTERVEADSLQNLRLMLGAGINYRLTNKTTVYGEVSMYNDTMRHNPSVMLDGFTYGSGANPGRTGATISAGAQYQLNTNWALRGNYGFETSDDKKEHRVNVGASYSF